MANRMQQKKMQIPLPENFKWKLFMKIVDNNEEVIDEKTAKEYFRNYATHGSELNRKYHRAANNIPELFKEDIYINFLKDHYDVKMVKGEINDEKLYIFYDKVGKKKYPLTKKYYKLAEIIPDNFDEVLYEKIYFYKDDAFKALLKERNIFEIYYYMKDKYPLSNEYYKLLYGLPEYFDITDFKERYKSYIDSSQDDKDIFEMYNKKKTILKLDSEYFKIHFKIPFNFDENKYKERYPNIASIIDSKIDLFEKYSFIGNSLINNVLDDKYNKGVFNIDENINIKEYKLNNPSETERSNLEIYQTINNNISQNISPKEKIKNNNETVENTKIKKQLELLINFDSDKEIIVNEIDSSVIEDIMELKTEASKKKFAIINELYQLKLINSKTLHHLLINEKRLQIENIIEFLEFYGKKENSLYKYLIKSKAFSSMLLSINPLASFSSYKLFCLLNDENEDFLQCDSLEKYMLKTIVNTPFLIDISSIQEFIKYNLKNENFDKNKHFDIKFLFNTEYNRKIITNINKNISYNTDKKIWEFLVLYNILALKNILKCKINLYLDKKTQSNLDLTHWLKSIFSNIECVNIIFNVKNENECEILKLNNILSRYDFTKNLSSINNLGQFSNLSKLNEILKFEM